MVDAGHERGVLKPMTLDAFLDWESQQERKYEFDGYQPVGMTGVSGAHSRVQVNLPGLLLNALRVTAASRMEAT